MTFQFGQITAASPLALAAAFNPPSLNRPVDSAVVTIRKALEKLPDEVQDGTLEELCHTFQTARAPTGDLADPDAVAPVIARAEWERLITEWRDAACESQRLGKLHGIAEARFHAALPERPAAPDVSRSVGLENINNMTIAEIKAAPSETHPAWIEYEAQVAARDEAIEDLRVSTGFREAEEAWEGALNVCVERARALLAVPAPDLVGVGRKLLLIQQEWGQFDDEEMKNVLTDLARLMPEEVAKFDVADADRSVH